MLALVKKSFIVIKKKTQAIILIVCMAILSLSANYLVDIFREIENAFSIGNSKIIESYMNSSIELETPTSKGIYSSSQAQIILDKFFKKYPPRGEGHLNKGNVSHGTKFVIFNYISNYERNFRVTVYAKKFGSDYLIQMIKIE